MSSRLSRSQTNDMSAVTLTPTKVILCPNRHTRQLRSIASKPLLNAARQRNASRLQGAKSRTFGVGTSRRHVMNEVHAHVRISNRRSCHPHAKRREYTPGFHLQD